MSFTNFGGGLVNTVVAGAGNNIATGLANQLTSNVQFSVSNVLAGAVTDSSGYALDAGQNYLLSQISSAIPTSVGNGVANAVVTQVASVGLNAAKSFASSAITNLLSGNNIFSGIGSALGTGAAGGGASGGGAGGFIGLHAQGLPDADYGGQRFTTQDIVFSIVPANAGPQTQAQPQSAAITGLDTAFNPDFAKNYPGIEALKGNLAVAGPGTGTDFSAGFVPKTGGTSALQGVTYSGSTIKPLW